MSGTRRTAAVVLLGVVVAALAPAASVRAQGEDVAARASEHFDRGTEFFNEGRFDAALAEFQRAYELAPAHQVLYNLARVHDELGHAVQAADTYQRYLDEARDDIGAQRRAEVERGLERNLARIARLEVRTNIAGATISVDGVDVATTPLDEPLRLSAGAHTVGARAAGYDSLRRAVQLAGGVEEVLELELSPLVDQRGTLRIVSDVPAVEVRVDDRNVGTTPLASTVPVAAGSHVVVGARAGYRSDRVEVDVEHGTETEVRLRMEVDDGASGALGQLVMHLPEAPHVLRIDGDTVQLLGGGTRLPAGRHRLDLEVAEREPWSGEVEVPAGDRVEVSPELLWTPEARAERVSAASSLRTVGQVVALGGGGIFLVAGGVFLWNQSEISNTDGEVQALQDEYDDLGCATDFSEPRCAEIDALEIEFEEEQTRQNAIEITTAIVAGVGALAAVVGIVIWASAPTDAEIDAEAHARGPSVRLEAGLGSMRLVGSF